jgi:5-formyltetrahydrofolate cyclo-ligase
VSAELARAKEQLRRELGRRRRAVEPAFALRAGRAVCAHLEGCAAFREASRVALYAAMPDELPSRPCFEVLRQRGAETCFPSTLALGLRFGCVSRWEDLEAGRYGVLEPPGGAVLRPLEEVDLVLVPGLAFDARGNRLGRGGGHYDAALSRSGLGPQRIGLAYAFQVLPQVPHGSRDRRVDAIVTESGLQWCSTD